LWLFLKKQLLPKGIIVDSVKIADTANESCLDQLDKELKVAKSDNGFKFWKTELKRLKDRKMKSNDVSIKNMVVRLQFMIDGLVYETAEESKINFQNDKLEYCKKLEKVLHSIEMN
jgi:hypothetical protein